MLYVPGYSSSNRKDIESLTTRLTAKIADESGQQVCLVSAPLGGAQGKSWTLMSRGLVSGEPTQMSAAYWHDGCREVSIERRKKYSLQVSVDELDPNSPQVTVEAMLEGGGVHRAAGSAVTGLFQDAARRVMHAADAIGIRALLVHALSDEAKAFYLRLGLDPSPLDPMTLMATLADLRAALEPSRPERR